MPSRYVYVSCVCLCMCMCARVCVRVRVRDRMIHHCGLMLSPIPHTSLLRAGATLDRSVRRRLQPTVLRRRRPAGRGPADCRPVEDAKPRQVVAA